MRSDRDDCGRAPQQRVTNSLYRRESTGCRLIENLNRVPAELDTTSAEEPLRASRARLQAETDGLRPGGSLESAARTCGSAAFRSASMIVPVACGAGCLAGRR